VGHRKEAREKPVKSPSLGAPLCMPLRRCVHVDTASDPLFTQVPSAATYPWMAFLLADGFFACGGSMIASNVLMTAAHCVETTPAASWKVVTFRTDRLTAAGIVQPVLKIHKHPNFHDENMWNDVALFFLGSPEANDGLHQPAFVELNRDDAVPTSGESLKAIGFGSTASGGSASFRMLEVNLPYIPTAQCTTTNWGSGQYGSSVNYAAALCAGEPGKDTCQGDSGGPLLVQRSGTWMVVGITSWGAGCSVFPGVYARVSTVASWIDSIIALEAGAATTVTTTSTATTVSISLVTSVQTVTSASPYPVLTTSTQTIRTTSWKKTKTVRTTSWKKTRTKTRTVFFCKKNRGKVLALSPESP